MKQSTTMLQRDASHASSKEPFGEYRCEHDHPGDDRTIATLVSFSPIAARAAAATTMRDIDRRLGCRHRGHTSDTAISEALAGTDAEGTDAPKAPTR
jgi:hypothetical protein